ncbi:MAG: antibiotic biosynthesis monooxygenase [Gloeomargaritaceae cyanobacterium C42_A2020_066]|nr:antibiotic biosynthesis monooxygenase [Gloeomargaritaceae cyanobacterium C42_A2020_066]
MSEQASSAVHAPIRVVARVVAQPQAVTQLHNLLVTLVAETRQEVGCLQYDLLRNLDDPTEFTFVETWASVADLERHLNAPHLQAALAQIPHWVAAGPDIRRYQQVV